MQEVNNLSMGPNVVDIPSQNNMASENSPIHPHDSEQEGVFSTDRTLLQVSYGLFT